MRTPTPRRQSTPSWVIPLLALVACSPDPADGPSEAGTSSSGEVPTSSSDPSPTVTSGDTPGTGAQTSGTTGSTTADETSVGSDSTTGGESTTSDGSSSTGPFDDESSSEGSTSTGEAPLPLPDGHATAACVFADGRAVLATSEASSVDPGRAAVRLFDPAGDELWASGFGAPEDATYLHELACVEGGTIYAVGLRGDGSKWSQPRGLLMRIDATTGALEWDHVELEFPSSEFRGLHAAASGLYVAGWRANAGATGTLWRFDVDGNEQWRLEGAGDADMLRDALLEEDVIYAVGEDFSSGVLARVSPDGNVLGSQLFDWPNDVSADFVVPDPLGGVLVVGRRETGFLDRVIWALPCDAEGCAAERVEVVDGEDRLHGFAIDGAGLWLINTDSTLYAASPDGTLLWEYETDFDWSYSVDRRSLLAIDDAGTVIVAGGDPAELVRLSEDDVPPS